MSQKKYRVVWTIDVESEEVNSPQEAVQDCWRRLQAHGNDWQWYVEDIDTRVEYTVDYEFCIEGDEPEVLQIGCGK